MDRQAIAEDVVSLYDMIGDAWLKNHEGTAPRDVHISLFERAHTYIIHKNISAERAIVPHSPGMESDQMPSEKQIKYAKDLGISEPEKMTRREISKAIEAAK